MLLALVGLAYVSTLAQRFGLAFNASTGNVLSLPGFRPRVLGGSSHTTPASAGGLQVWHPQVSGTVQAVC